MISLENLCKNIANTAILKNINLHIERGEFIAIMGQSGSGKSTLLNLIGALDEPSSGEYFFNNFNTKKLKDDEKARLRREEMGFIFQRYNLLSLLNAKENIALPATYAGMPTKERDARVKELLKNLGMQDKLLAMPNELSGGQQQRISIARALMNSPSVILADEPTGALDSKAGKAVLDILKELNAKGQSIILVTHDEKIAKTANKIIHVKDGEIVKTEINKKETWQSQPLKNQENTIQEIFLKEDEQSQPLNAQKASLNEERFQEITAQKAFLSEEDLVRQPLNPQKANPSEETPLKNLSNEDQNQETHHKNQAQKNKFKEKEKLSFNFYKTQLNESLKMSVSSILAHKLRSLLTMLGIIIGIASIVCVTALGLGAKESILSSISSIGTNTIQIIAGRSLGDTRAWRTNLALSDLSLLKNLPYLDAVEANLRNLGISTYKNTSLRALLYGVGENHLTLMGLKLEAGRGVNEFDIKNNTNIAIIDSNTKKNLFKGMDAEKILGKIVIYDMQPLRVVGVLKPKDSYNFTDDTIRLYTPYTTSMNKLTGNKRIKSIITKVKDGFDPAYAEKDMIKILSIKRGKKDFYTVNSDSIQKAVEENSATLMALISSIALISLIVGGIGVMNIMLVCVSERTKEIGIKMAIGARRADVLMQFLIEAILICFFGSILGIILAFSIIESFNALGSQIKMIISTNAIILGLLSSVIIGIIFGFFPAKSAAKLNPIKALSKA